MPAERLGEVRLADNNGEYELHMYPGAGIIDFADTFRRIEATGYAGHYTTAFGTIEDMLGLARCSPATMASTEAQNQGRGRTPAISCASRRGRGSGGMTRAAAEGQTIH